MPENKFVIVNKHSPDFRVYPGDAVYGGPMPSGRGIIMNFCLERIAVPSYTEHKIGEGGVVEMNAVLSQTAIGNVEREMLCAITMNTDAAKRLYRWLGGHIEQLEKMGPPNE